MLIESLFREGRSDPFVREFFNTIGQEQAPTQRKPNGSIAPIPAIRTILAELEDSTQNSP
jgi:hypothetical protein